MIQRLTLMAAGLAALGMAGQASAQAAPVTGSVGELRTEMDRRYDAALALTQAREVIAADDSRFLWASEAKVACGIAIGYLKHRTVDADSITRCRMAGDAMTATPAPMQDGPGPVATAPVPPPLPGGCPLGLPVAVYFGWAEDAVPPEMQTMAGDIARSIAACGISGLTVTGYADRSGTDAYNDGLSRRRADNVAEALAAAGLSRDNLRVEARGENDPAIATADGVREPKNRRVQIDAAGNGK